MVGKSVLFWTFALLQFATLFLLVKTSLEKLNQAAGLNSILDGLEILWIIVLLMSTIGIEYLIYSKK